MSMKATILSPGERLLDADVESVTLPAVKGQMTVLAGHDTLLALLSSGRLYCIRVDDRGARTKEEFEVSGGIAEITQKAVTVCTPRATRPGAAKVQKGRQS